MLGNPDEYNLPGHRGRDPGRASSSAEERKRYELGGPHRGDQARDTAGYDIPALMGAHSKSTRSASALRGRHHRDLQRQAAQAGRGALDRRSAAVSLRFFAGGGAAAPEPRGAADRAGRRGLVPDRDALARAAAVRRDRPLPVGSGRSFERLARAGARGDRRAARGGRVRGRRRRVGPARRRGRRAGARAGAARRRRRSSTRRARRSPRRAISRPRSRAPSWATAGTCCSNRGDRRSPVAAGEVRARLGRRRPRRRRRSGSPTPSRPRSPCRPSSRPADGRAPRCPPPPPVEDEDFATPYALVNLRWRPGVAGEPRRARRLDDRRAVRMRRWPPTP